jgi:hypothetical protein
LNSATLDSKFCLGSSVTGIAFSYGSTHYWQQQFNGALKRLHILPLENHISQDNIRICNAWIDSSTGTQIIAGNFGLKLQE